MLVYEVNITIAKADSDSYRKWLKSHVDEIVEIEGFARALILRNLDSPEGHDVWTVQYFVKSKRDLDRYLDEDAPRLRAEAEKYFAGKFKAQRRVLEVEETVVRASGAIP